MLLEHVTTMEKVLEMSPTYLDAKLVVGAHNYVLGSLPWGRENRRQPGRPERQQGEGHPVSSGSVAGEGRSGNDARPVLILFLRREHRYSEALETARELLSAYPHNSLAGHRGGEPAARQR